MTFQVQGIIHANAIATQAEKARAWDALMGSVAPDDAAAIQDAATVLVDAVNYRMNQLASSP